MPQASLVATWGEHLTDAELFAIALAVLGIAILWLATAAWLHRRNLRAIGVRVHVSGTRGKTTTTRMIAAGLRAGGLRTVAKSTGSEPRFVLPDGVEEPWPRRGVPSIREQAAVVRKARRLGAEALVVECMAIRPEFVWASETYLIEATTAVITNARADHFEDLGLDPHAVEEALRWAAPRNGALVVAEEAATPALLAWAKRRNSTVTVVATRGLDPMAADKALALAVCRRHGIGDDVAGPAIDHAVQDPGHFSVHTMLVGDRRVTFANAFACNDAESLALLWPQTTGPGAPVVVLNARQDRPLRTKSFLQFLAHQTPVPSVYIVGDPLAVRYAREAGLPRTGVRLLRHHDPEAALKELAAASAEGGVIWGVGNYKGFGSRLIADLASAA